MTRNTYERSVNVLLDSYNAGTLFHGRCQHCAVGTLLGTSKWAEEFYTERIGGTVVLRDPKPEIWHIYEDTGLTKGECMKIENAFEKSIHKTPEGYEYWTYPKNRKAGQYKGLVAVLTVMETMVEEDIHQQAEDNMCRLQEIARGYEVTV